MSFLRLVEETYGPKKTPPVPTPRPTASADATNAGRYAAAALQRELDNVANAPEGTRNGTLNTAAFNLGQFLPAGHLDHDTVVEALHAAARANGLPADEAARTIRSGIQAGEKNPRVIPDKDPTWPPTTTPAAPSATAAAHAASTTASTSASAPTAASASTTDSADDQPRERTSWWPRDLTATLNGEDAEPKPEFLLRDDGKHLFYAGKVNGIIGESESGKTWLALLAVKQTLKMRMRVLYIDFEDTAAGIVGRLRAIGVTSQDLEWLTYIGPDEGLHLAAHADLFETLEAVNPVLAILDGFNAAMTLMGLDLMSNTDATRFSQQLLKPLAGTGACIIYVDHVPKAVEGRGKGGIGAQAKRAMTTGCALTVAVRMPFGRGQRGLLDITVDKDRPGHVRAVSAFAKKAGQAVLTSTEDGSVDVVVTAQSEVVDPGDGKVTPEMRRREISEFIEDRGGEVPSGNRIVNGVPRKKEDILKDLDWLVDHGYVERTPSGSGFIHRLLRPYPGEPGVFDDF